jgi:hypothetical protein
LRLIFDLCVVAAIYAFLECFLRAFKVLCVFEAIYGLPSGFMRISVMKGVGKRRVRRILPAPN